MGHKFLTRISHYLRKGTFPAKPSRSITIDNVARRANVIGCKSNTAINSGPLSSPTIKTEISSSPNAPRGKIRSRSICSLEKSDRCATTSTASHSHQTLRGHQVLEHRQHDHSDFITTLAETNHNGDNNGNGKESLLDSSRAFPEPDRDSISSTSSLEILVQ